MRSHCRWLLFGGLLGPAFAQTFAPLARPVHVGNPSAFDTVRRRLVMFGEDGTTWELDGGELLPRTPQTGAPQPTPRTKHAMCYDEAQRRVLMFGGESVSGGGQTLLNDTWVYDGSGWNRLTGGQTPSARGRAAMTWDATRNRVVMWGGIGIGAAPVVGWINDTWEHDGTGWLRRFPTTSPTGQPSVMVFDRQRSVAVLWGALPETWEWNGTDWSLRGTGSTAAANNGTYTLAFDASRNRTVLVGAPDGRVHEWDGISWSASLPTPGFVRLDAASWFDPSCGCVTLLGGRDMDHFERADEWRWDGQALTQVQGDAGPRAHGGVMFSDPPRGRVVHFGGRFTFSLSAETWALANGTWSAVPSLTGPSARSESAATHDLLRSESLLFGGLGPNGVLGDTWSLAGAGWVPRSTTGPSPRANATMAADLVRGVVVLFGGRDLGASYQLSDTWEWNGAVWTQRATTVQPSARFGAAMAFHPALGSMLLFGGATLSAGSLDDTWTWDGTQWTALTPPNGPPPLGTISMSTDATNNHCILVGSTGLFQQVWWHDGSDWVQGANIPIPIAGQAWHPCGTGPTLDTMICARQSAFNTTVPVAAELTFMPGTVATIGAGCGTPAATLLMRSRPRAGAINGLELVANPTRAVLFALDLSSGNTPIGSGCTVWLSPGFLGLAQISDAAGFAKQPLSLPASALGFNLFAQAAVLEPMSSNGIVLTQGLRLTLGD